MVDIASQVAAQFDAVQAANLQQAKEQDRAQDAAQMMDKQLLEKGVDRKDVHAKHKALTDLTKKVQKGQASKKGKKGLKSDAEVDKQAAAFEKQNPRLAGRLGKLAREFVDPEKDNSDTLQDKLEKLFPSLADRADAMDFLEEVATGDFKEHVTHAKETFHAEQSRGIKAEKQVRTEAEGWSNKELGDPQALEKFVWDLQKSNDSAKILETRMKSLDKTGRQQLTKFLHHTLGKLLNSYKSNTDPAQLKESVDLVRTLQALKGVDSYFEANLKRVLKQCAAAG